MAWRDHSRVLVQSLKEASVSWGSSVGVCFKWRQDAWQVTGAPWGSATDEGMLLSVLSASTCNTTGVSDGLQGSSGRNQ